MRMSWPLREMFSAYFELDEHAVYLERLSLKTHGNHYICSRNNGKLNIAQ